MTLYYMSMYRFGEDYSIIADDEKKGLSALKKKYIELYKIYNGERPTKEEINKMIEDVETTEMQLNTVFDPCM